MPATSNPASGSSPSPRARQGKLARLPFELRELLNRRIRDGWGGTRLIAWLSEAAPDLGPVNAQNLTNWRQGGYRDWLREQARIEEIRQRTETVRRELEAGGFSVLDKTICEVAERLTDADLEPAAAARAVAVLKTAVTGAGRLQVYERRARLAEEALALEREKFAAAQARAAQADRAEGVVKDETLSPDEKQRRIREIFGLA